MQGTDTIAFEAAAALDAYEEQLASLRRPGASPGRVASMQVELRRICSLCLVLPQLSASSLALLLAHHRLLAVLAGSTPGLAAEHRASFDAVEQCVRGLRRQCSELFRAPHLQ